MEELKNIFGKYYLKEQDNPEFASEFILDLYEEKGKIKFNFEMVTFGDFGKIGKNWIGISVFRSDHFALIVEKELDWAMAKNDKEKTINDINYLGTLPIEIYPNEDEYEEKKEIIVYHRQLDRQLTLLKIK